MDKLLLTPTEAAQVLGIGRSKVYELMQTGQLTSVHIGACRRVPADALKAFLEQLRTAGSGPPQMRRARARARAARAKHRTGGAP